MSMRTIIYTALRVSSGSSTFSNLPGNESIESSTMKNIAKVFSFLLTLSFILPGCTGSGLPQDPQPFRIAISGYLMGQVIPCKCAGKPMGGMSRRSNVLKTEAGDLSNLIMVDAGNFLSLDMNEGEERTELVLAALKKMGVNAVNVGTRDVRAGLTELRRIQSIYDINFVSANLLDDATGKPAFDPYRIIKIPGENGPQNVAVIGMANGGPTRHLPPESGLRFDQPARTLKQAVKKVRDKVSCIILLTDADRRTAAGWLNLLGDSGRIDIVISSNIHPNRVTIVNLGDVPFTTCGRQGKILDILEMEPHNKNKWLMKKSVYPIRKSGKQDLEMLNYLNSLREGMGLEEYAENQEGDIIHE